MNWTGGRGSSTRWLPRAEPLFDKGGGYPRPAGTLAVRVTTGPFGTLFLIVDPGVHTSPLRSAVVSCPAMTAR